MSKQVLKKLRIEFREGCLKRDKNKCLFCNIKDNLEVHHITDRKEMPNDGYAISNGVTLCAEHHLVAEKFHISKGQSWDEGFHPNDLYSIIGSSKEKAIEDSKNLV